MGLRWLYLCVGSAMLVVAPFPATPAAAQLPDGVFVDPESPAGVEYAIPLDRARRDAGGEGSGRRDDTRADSSGSEVPLFGAGITQRGGEAATRRSVEKKPEPEEAANGEETSDRADGLDEDRADELDEPRSSALASTASDSATAETIAIALAVLGLGCLVGLLLRHILRSS